jgi:hypothetical protein
MPLIQWIMLNLVETSCFIESNSELTANGQVCASVSSLIESDSSVMAAATIIAAPSCLIESSSQVIANGSVIHKTKPQPAFENDPANLPGVFAIVPNFTLGKRKYKYVEIEFTFRDAKYRSEFYSGKEIAVAINQISMETANDAPTVSLNMIEGLHGKTHNLQEQR